MSDFENARKIVNTAYLICLREIDDEDTALILLGLRDEHLEMMNALRDMRDLARDAVAEIREACGPTLEAVE